MKGPRPHVQGLFKAVASALAAGFNPSPSTPSILDRAPGFQGVVQPKMEIDRINTTYFSPLKRNGAKECARRRKQRLAGQLNY